MANVFATYIIPQGLITQARSKVTGVEGFPGLAGMFITPVIKKNDPDNAPTTHWISSGWMSQEEVDYLNSQLPGPFESSVDEDPHIMMERLVLRLKPGNMT